MADRERFEVSKPTVKSAATVGVGTSIGVVVVWLLSLFVADIPDPVGGAITGIFVWVTQRFPGVFGT